MLRKRNRSEGFQSLDSLYVSVDFDGQLLTHLQDFECSGLVAECDSKPLRHLEIGINFRERPGAVGWMTNPVSESGEAYEIRPNPRIIATRS